MHAPASPGRVRRHLSLSGPDFSSGESASKPNRPGTNSLREDTAPGTLDPEGPAGALEPVALSPAPPLRQNGQH